MDKSNSYSWRLKLFFSAINRASRRGYRGTEKHYQPTGSNCHMWSTQLNTVPIILKCTWHLSCILGHKTNIHKFKRIKIIQIVFSDHNRIRPEVNYREITGKYSRIWKDKHMIPLWPSNPMTRYLPKLIENLCVHKDLFVKIYSIFINNCQKLEITRMSFNGQNRETKCCTPIQWHTALQ